MADKHAAADVTETVPADADGIARAAQILLDAGIAAVPTETVYGLAARADSADAVAGIYRAKGRPSFNPLIVHVASMEQARKIAVLGERAAKLAEEFWPGPLTLVLPLREDAGIAPAVTAGLPTIALRMPAHPAMRQLLEECGVPLAAPSANRSGAVSPTSAAHVGATLAGRVPLVIDGGATSAGLESTIVALRDSGWSLLRPGPITLRALTDLLGPATPVVSAEVEAPGQLASHYSPGKPVRLDAAQGKADEFLIGFGPVAGDASLSASGDLAEAAARLYALLHRAAASDKSAVAVAPIPDKGIGAAINDRLRRAAADPS
ncbi:L-threonylcarbamoyladenylate synthase [Alteriqipengyuania sp. WL0013]|uniref:L-threonylcarbamoyladenylate synthase n=1 Tax=Alteriqipengyuania sp. WL0013 TaxID=3110773 RepID=UPI002C977E5B|nr:L-threonylcarbamoyladenylate synthase [Alteriqipengyuania sp. WL0013]MEB3416317.1 L-threonylcarbamoyladenylate synthase [Alteriqipengyuania sp. WL0013]